MEESSDDDDEQDLFRINSKSDHGKHPMFNVNIMNIDLTIMADSGSTITPLDESDYNRVGQPSLQESHVRIYLYQSDTPVQVLGKFSATMSASNGQKVKRKSTSSKESQVP